MQEADTDYSLKTKVDILVQRRTVLEKKLYHLLRIFISCISPYSTFRTHLNNQIFAMLLVAIFSTLQGTPYPDTSQTCKELKNAIKTL